MPHVPRNVFCYPDASQIIYLPFVSVDWIGNPETVQFALDELSSRLHNIETHGIGSSDASSINYNPSSDSLSCWYGSSDPGNVNDALDQIVLRLCDIEHNPILSYVFDIRLSPPSSAEIGQFYYNQIDALPYFFNGVSWVSMSSSVSTSLPFGGITTGTNTSAVMIVGSGASINFSGSGVINSNRYNSNSIISLSDGGTNASLSPVSGGIVYSSGSALSISSSGSSGNLLTSNGASSPSWTAVQSPLSISGGNLGVNQSLITHNNLGGLTTGDPHTQYLFTTPTSSTRNIIEPSGTNVSGFIVRQSSAGTSHSIFDIQSLTPRSIFKIEVIALNNYKLTLNTNNSQYTSSNYSYIKMDNNNYGGYAGYIDTSGSENGSLDPQYANVGGYIKTSGGNPSATFAYGGYIDTSGGDGDSAYGGYINTKGNSEAGGYINTSGGITVSSAGGYINTSGDGAAGGNIKTSGGANNINNGGQGGSVYTYGGNANQGYGGVGGTISTYGGSGNASGSPGGAGGSGGYINTSGADSVYPNNGGSGGFINTSAGSAVNGGSINTSGGTSAGGSINTSNGGGSIDTTGNGSIQFGIVSNRITVQGTSGSGGRIYTLPNVGTNTFFVMSAGSQSITGAKTFSSEALLLAGGGSGIATFTYANTSNNRTITFPDPGGNRSVCIATESTTETQALFATATSGQPAFRNIVAGDLPSLTGIYVRIVPSATSDNTIAPTGSGIVSLVVKQTATSPAKIFEVQTSGGSSIFAVGDTGGNTDVTVGTNLIVSGNLTVNGTVTTISTTNLIVSDNFITINSIAAVLDAGIEVERHSAGTGDNAFIRFKESLDQQWYIDNGTYEWIVARKFSSTITGNGSSTSFNITHNMNTKNVNVQVYDSSDKVVYPDISTVNVNYVTIDFSVAPLNLVTYRVVIVG